MRVLVKWLRVGYVQNRMVDPQRMKRTHGKLLLAFGAGIFATLASVFMLSPHGRWTILAGLLLAAAWVTLGASLLLGKRKS